MGVNSTHMNLFTLQYQLERDHRPFTREEVRRLPSDRRGVYALWLPAGETAECLYVGISTTCIRRRLLDHLSNETNPELRRQLRLFRDDVLFTAAFTQTDAQTRRLEAALISHWQPQCNIQHR